MRYMFSPKSHSVINIIAWVSLIAVAVPTAAVIILLAMFEGLTGVIDDLDTALDADIEVVAQRGQTFDMEVIDYEALRTIEGIESITCYLEQSVMASSTGRRIPIMLRGVERSYYDVIAADDYLVRGDADAPFDGDIVLGAALASSLAAYGIGTEIDEAVALMELERVQQLLNYKSRISAIAIKIVVGEDADRVAEAVAGCVGEEYRTMTRDQKNASINAILAMEKFAITLIGAFIALIATFSIVGSVVMLMTEKMRDIATLEAMGAHRRLITSIFVGEGVLLTATGCLIGAMIGIAIALGQQHYGWVAIPGDSFLESYPVELKATDVVMVVGIVLITGIAVAWFTVRAKLKNIRN